MTENRSPTIAGILLAAGSSTRFGAPKQFIQFEGKSLLRRTAEAMAASVCKPGIVVLGPQFERAIAEIDVLGLHAVMNAGWESGMASSIDVGIGELLRLTPNVDAVVITLCDQPFVTSGCIDRLAERFAASRPEAVAAEYNGVAGVPALFAAKLFPQLRKITGDKGARELIRSPLVSLLPVSMPEAAVDIDTPGDLADATAQLGHS